MIKVLGIINNLNTGGAEKLIVDTLPLLNMQCKYDLYLLTTKNYPFEELLFKKWSHKIIQSKTDNVYHIKHLINLIKLMKNYDVVHVHLFPAQYYVWLAKILSFSKTKIIVTEHNTTNNRLSHKFIALFDKYTYRFFDATVCISEEIKQIMLKYTGLKENKFPVIENGVLLETIFNAQPISKNEIEGMNENDIMLLQVSGFRTQKDQKTLIKSLKHLPENVKLCLAGVGVTLDECKNLVNQLNLNHRVFFVGVRTDIPQLLKTADIVVLSSHFEGLSLASIEGMASGKPFIASDVPGLHEVVKGAGLLFEDKNDKQLALHIQKLMEDKVFYEKVALACQERAKQYDIQKMVDQQVELYKKLCQ